MKPKHTFILAFLALLPFSTITAQELMLRAYVNRTALRVNQQFELSVELSGSSAQRAPEPEVPNLDDFASYVGSSTSTNMQIVNGQMSVSRTITHIYIATTEGKFQIPAITLEYRGETYRSDPIDIAIGKGQPAAPSASPGSRNSPADNQQLSDQLFFRAEVDDKNPYQNQQVTVTYKIYTLVNVTNYGVSQLPNTVGFWVEEFEKQKRIQSYEDIINGRRYRVYEIKKMALFPQGSGEKTLEPMTIECEVQVPRRRRRGRDIFDGFFNDPFFRQTERVAVRSNAVTIDVLPLPDQGKPTDFSGVIGDFSITSSIDKDKVKTNEAITLRVKVSGEGNIRIIPTPKIDFPSDFEVYEPKINENIKRNSQSISGSKTFEYVLIPRFPGAETIKAISFSYFDLPSKRYKTVRTSSMDISVSKGEDQFVNVGIGNSKEDVKFIGKDIRFIQTRVPELQKAGDVFYKRGYFYLLLIVPLITLAGAFGYRSHLEKLSSNVAYARSRKANQMALKRLREAQKEMKNGNQTNFYAEVSKALMGFIGDKLNVSSAGLITDEVERMLNQHNSNGDTISNYITCLQTCDYKRFAPSDSNEVEMKDFFEKARDAIVQLEKVI